MTRFLCSGKIMTGRRVFVTDKKEVHHIKHVLRLKPGRKVLVFDGRGNEFYALLRELSREGVSFDVGGRLDKPQAATKVTVACAIPKNVKMEDIVDKLTQLGVYKIIPLACRRAIVRPDREKMAMRTERWRKIALSAAKQSQRSEIPSIEPLTQIKELVAQAHNYDLRLIPTLCKPAKSLKQVLSRSKNKTKEILLLIGPEGDFTTEEVELAEAAGFFPVSLGNQVLRVDTAALAAASFIMLNTGEA